MLTINRTWIATCLCVAAPTAYADEPTLTDPPGKESCESELANCPSAVPPTPVTQPRPMPPPPAMAEERPWYLRVGWGLSAGGGVDGFVGGAAADVTNVGGGWNVRLTMGTREYFAGELLYIGSAQSIAALGLANGADLVGNGIQGDFRLNLIKNYPAQPFAYVGAAWRHYDVTNANFNISDVNDSADVFELPVGIGLAGYYRGFMADARAEYRWAWGNNVVSTGDSDIDRWNVTGNLGVEF